MSEGTYRENDAYTGRPSVCRNCGALVGAGESKCGMCETAVVGTRASLPQPDADPATLNFIRAVISRPAPFTIIFLTANVFVFLLMTLTGGSSNQQTLLQFGAKFNSLIDAGQWWRLVTPVFIHIGPLHLLVNMYGLFMLGPYVEKLYGSARFVVFWVLTGVAGVVASYYASSYDMHTGFFGRFLFRGGDGPSAGASGALFGLIGVLFVFGIKYRHELPEGFKRAFGTGMLPTILINLFIGYTVPFIDNAAHLGGLVAGMVLALVVGYKRPGQPASVAVMWHIFQAAMLVFVIAGFTMVALRYGGASPQLAGAAGNLFDGGSRDVEAYIVAINDGRKAFVNAVNGDSGSVNAVIEKLDNAPALNDKAGSLRDELKTLLTRARDLPAEESNDRKAQRGRAQQLRKLVADYQDWQARSDQWVKEEGNQFGIEVKEEASPSPQATGGGR